MKQYVKNIAREKNTQLDTTQEVLSYINEYRKEWDFLKKKDEDLETTQSRRVSFQKEDPAWKNTTDRILDMMAELRREIREVKQTTSEQFTPRYKNPLLPQRKDEEKGKIEELTEKLQKMEILIMNNQTRDNNPHNEDRRSRPRFQEDRRTQEWYDRQDS